MRNHRNGARAFTIVELLTVMGVIALLIGMLVPALSKVRDHAKNVRQRAQLHTIEVALEMFKNDMSDYPDSASLPGFQAGGIQTTGAQRLAEALVGRDLQGYDPKTSWNADYDYGSNPDGQEIYATSPGSTQQQVKDSIERRKGPYLKLENVGAFSIDQLYNQSVQGTDRISGNAASRKPAPFITDVFTDKVVQLKITNSSGQVTGTKIVKAGTPILYYKANASNKDLGKNTPTKTLDYRTYNPEDNQQFMLIGRMMAPNPTTEKHPLVDDADVYMKFYDFITNPQVPSSDGVGYNPDSFILMSAGKDGKFGTADDICNFGD